MPARSLPPVPYVENLAQLPKGQPDRLTCSDEPKPVDDTRGVYLTPQGIAGSPTLAQLRQALFPV